MNDNPTEITGEDDAAPIVVAQHPPPEEPVAEPVVDEVVEPIPAPDPVLTVADINAAKLANLVADGYDDAQHELVLVGERIIGFQPKIIVNVASVTAKIKSQAGEIISGIESGWRMTRARDRAVQGDHAELDLLMAQKEAIRSASNQAEDDIQGMTDEQLAEYEFHVDLSVVKTAPITRLTVGAFIDRFTKTEYGDINAAAAANTDVAKAMFVLQNRTHADVAEPKTRADVEGFEAAGLLGPVQEPDSYQSRVDELLRPGAPEEAYRGS